MGYSRVNFSLGLAKSSDLDEAVGIINRVGTELATEEKWKKKIIDAPQFDSISKLSGSSVDITIVGKVQPSDQWRVTAEMRRRLMREFGKNGIELA